SAGRARCAPACRSPSIAGWWSERGGAARTGMPPCRRPAHRTPPGALVCDRAAVVPEARVALLARAFGVAVGREANNRVPGVCGGGLAGLRVEGATKANVRARQLQADCRPLTPTPCPPPPEPQAGGADALGDADGPITDSLLGGG